MVEYLEHDAILLPFLEYLSDHGRRVIARRWGKSLQTRKEYLLKYSFPTAQVLFSLHPLPSEREIFTYYSTSGDRSSGISLIEKGYLYAFAAHFPRFSPDDRIFLYLYAWHMKRAVILSFYSYAGILLSSIMNLIYNAVNGDAKRFTQMVDKTVVKTFHHLLVRYLNQTNDYKRFSLLFTTMKGAKLE
jgi:hypothetical protein